MDEELHRILDDEYLAGLAVRPVDGLRAARAECRSVETKLSYLRRLVQGHHDVVSAERRRRAEGGAPGDVSALVEQLPAILADRVRGPGTGRLAPAVEPGTLTGELVDRVTALVDRVPVDELTSAPEGDLTDLATDLADLETAVSATRRSLLDRIDALEAELTRRYRDGEASVDELLVEPDHRDA